ncbi:MULTISPECIES: FAD-dependent oxidoreductase [Pseudomonas]|uniref:FAD-dependent oxidoreductase n=1 Tax=Pseudomonas canavaninivorans TaxID=2842348 RepID=A0ABX8QAT5_PSECO|nr:MULTISPECIES: FAD-dependent oxidoreductase [Pseudomonas]MBO1537121.1 FAD-dependent oxidoreductase [Pseudomonas sp. OA65]QXI51448.1 FAD-dependent oxidoreductase [Pseudomonas alvandae]
MSAKFPTVAIVGSGPSGCYVAQFLQKKWSSAQITIFEALPVPYGLVRYGVAADHQGSKTVIQQFERMFEKGGVDFRGNVNVGRDISYSKLAESYDVVVLATGLSHDADLDIHVHPSAPVVGAGRLLKALNGHPEVELLKNADGTTRELGRHVAVIGSGNVAIDVIRMIAKTDRELEGSDISDEVRTKLNVEQVKSLTLVSRSSAVDAKCDGSMMAELLSLPGVCVRVEGIVKGEGGAIPELLTAASNTRKTSNCSRLSVNFIFNALPSGIDNVYGQAKLTTINRISCISTARMFDTVITAIGFNNGTTKEATVTPRGLGADAIYQVGWLKRGPKGTVAENRKDAKLVAEAIFSDFESGVIKAGKPGLISIERELSSDVVNYIGWRRIDEYEQNSAKSGRCRKKINDIRTMLTIAHGANFCVGEVNALEVAN